MNRTLAFLLLAAATSIQAQTPVRYRISFPNAVHHEADVQAVFADVAGSTLDVVMSRSSPGRYALHEFVKNVYHVRATDGAGHPLVITRPDPYGWKVTLGADHTVVFGYTVFGDYADGTYNGIDETHAHLNMPATLAWALGMQDRPASVSFDLAGRNWQVATQMLPQGVGTWGAPNLDRLMDCPVELSRHALPEWKVEDKTFRLSLHHQGTEQEAEHYARLCQAVVLEEEGVFGRLPEYEGGTYTFLVDYLPYVAPDGMEHRNSTVITNRRSLAGNERELIGAVSHEFFHSWNVKRIRPASLQPFDFERANMSGELWFAEGFTNYYGILTLRRAGILDPSGFNDSMMGAVNQVLTDPGRLLRSATEMSQLAPFVDAATSIDSTNFRNTYISYYTYGQALGLGIDLALRIRFPGKSLDDWMRTVWRNHPDSDRSYTSGDLEAALAEMTGDRAFASEIFRRYIHGREAMDYQSLLAPAGLLLRKAHPNTAWWGSVRWKVSSSGLEIATETRNGTPLYEAGLDKGDAVLEVNGKALETEDDLTTAVEREKAGDVVRLRVRTRAGDKTLTLRTAVSPQWEMVPYEQAGQPVTAFIQSFRKSWLGSKALHPLPAL